MPIKLVLEDMEKIGLSDLSHTGLSLPVLATGLSNLFQPGLGGLSSSSSSSSSRFLKKKDDFSLLL